MAKYIMEGQVYGGGGVPSDPIEVCVQFDTDDISWLKDKKLYRCREKKIHRLLNKKIKGKSAIRYIFNKLREAAPEDVVELSLNKPIIRPLAHIFFIPVVASEEDREGADGKRIGGELSMKLCIEFDSEETWDRHKDQHFGKAFALIEEALSKKWGRPIKARDADSIGYHRQALEEDEVDLKLTKD